MVKIKTGIFFKKKRKKEKSVISRHVKLNRKLVSVAIDLFFEIDGRCAKWQGGKERKRGRTFFLMFLLFVRIFLKRSTMLFIYFFKAYKISKAGYGQNLFISMNNIITADLSFVFVHICSNYHLTPLFYLKSNRNIF